MRGVQIVSGTTLASNVFCLLEKGTGMASGWPVHMLITKGNLCKHGPKLLAGFSLSMKIYQAIVLQIQA